MSRHDVSTLDLVLQIVGRSLRSAGTLASDSDVFALGADSVTMMSVVAQLEQQFDIEFELEHLVKETLRTPQAIVALLSEKYAVAGGPAL